MNRAEADQLHRAFVFAAERDEVFTALDRLDSPTEAGTLAAEVELELRLSALRGLRRIVGDNATEARDIIVNRLLPLCVQQDEGEAVEMRVGRINCRELAGEWLNAITGPQAVSTLDAALAYLLAKLQSVASRRPACWTLSEIGYRTPEVMIRLWQIAGAEDHQCGDTALGTLAALEPTGDERRRCLEAALAVARERLPHTITAALVALPDPFTIFALAEAWLNRSDAELEAVSEPLFSVFAQIGAALVEPEAIDQACSAIARLHARVPAALDRRLRLAGYALPHLDSPLATEMLLRLLAKETAAASYDRWLVMLRLEECCRPRQLDGFEGEAARNPMALAALSAHVMALGTHLGRDSTHDGQVKLAALRTALLLGAPEAIGWLESALASEENPYLQQAIMEVYASLRVAPLPEPIPRWITEEVQLGREAVDNLDLMRRLAASRVARSAATEEAFDLLARPGLMREGAVMLETAEGLVTVTLVLGADAARRPRVLERLFEAVARPATRPQLSSACCALAAAAHRDWLAEEPWRGRLLLALTNESDIPLQPYDRAQLVSAVSTLPHSTLPRSVEEALAGWARTRDDTLGARAAQALVELGQFSAHADWLAPKLGLRAAENGRWDWSSDAAGQLEWAPFGVALLYSGAPAPFTPAFCSVLADERWFIRHDAVGALLRLVLANRATLTEPVRESLFARVRRRHSSRFADPPLLGQAAMLAPELFAREDWNAVCPDWMDDARAALADALGGLPSSLLILSPETRRHAASQLLALARDGQFAVRRAAQRGLGRVLPEALESLCSALAKSPVAEERSLAAEAWVWLPLFAFSPPDDRRGPTTETGMWLPDLDGLRKGLEGDQSKRVRETARAAGEARQRREWAHSYFLQLSVITNPSDQDLLRNWKLGNALARTGDDDTLRRLRGHLEATEMAPCVRFQLGRVAKDMEKQWEAVTKKWPQPTLALPGGLEEIEGRLRSGEREWAVRYTLWHVAGIAPEAERRWGGVAQVASAGLELLEAVGESGTLVLDDGRAAKLQVHGVSSDGLAAFRGVGEYPQR
jgi:hypothetical protein